MALEFTFGGIVGSAGIRPVFTPQAKAQLAQAFGFQNVQVLEEEEAMLKGLLGHPVYMPIVFEAFSWDEQIDTSSYITHTTEQLYFPIAIVEFSRAKVIEMSTVEGRDGTVKEYGSHGDYVVNISALLIGDMDDEGVPSETNRYPIELKQKLMDYEYAKVAIPVAGKPFEQLGIENLVIKSIRWPAMVGNQTAQAVELECYSDMPVELKLKGEL